LPGLSLIALLASLALAAGTPAASASQTNLLQNPGAEAGTGAGESETVDPPPDWTVTGEFTAVKYGAEGGFPTPANGTAVEGGTNFFGGGNSEVSTATQTVNVSASAAAIETGKELATLSADLGGYSSQGDNMVITATYLSATGAALGSLTIGPVTATERNDETELLPRSATGAIPAGTRSIQVVMTSTRLEGEYDDGYGDNVSLTLGGPEVFGSTGVVSAPADKQCLSKRAFPIHINQPAGITYRSVAVYVNGRRVSLARGSRITAPVNLRGLPKGRYTVKITITTNTGKEITGTRIYHTCVPKKHG
jgi:hypothetical protein